MNKQTDPAAPDAPAPIPDAEKKASDVTNTPPVRDGSTPEEDNDHGPEEGDEDLDQEEDEYALDEDADPRLVAAIPTFRHRHAFRIALRAMGDGEPLALECVDGLRAVFARIRTGGTMATETAWRMLRAPELHPDLQTWEQREQDAELPLAVFVAVAAALIPIADAQVAAFDQVVKELHGEERLAAMRRSRAGRRAKREARKARRPAAVKKLLAIKDRNRKAAGAPPPPPKPQTPTKGKAKSTSKNKR